MVKNSKISTKQPSKQFRLQMKLILFWYNKIKNYILIQQQKNKNNYSDYPTIYISRKYPKINILELYHRINNHLMKYFPNIYTKLNPEVKELKNKNENNFQEERNNEIKK